MHQRPNKQKGLVLAIDQGTTGTTCVLYDRYGQTHGKAYRSITQIYPHEGWVEHDPMEIWRSVASAARELAAASELPPTEAGLDLATRAADGGEVLVLVPSRRVVRVYAKKGPADDG